MNKLLAAAQVLLCIICCSPKGHTQNIGIPSIPTPQAAAMTRYDNAGSTTPTTSGQVQMGATANDINRMQQQQSPSMQGALADQQRIERERREYKEAIKEASADLDRIERQRLIASEVDTTFGNPPVMDKDKYEATKPFWDALVVLTDMGNGKRPFSITEAIYTVENAYFHRCL